GPRPAGAGGVLVSHLGPLGHVLGEAGAAAGQELGHELLGLGVRLHVRLPVGALGVGHEVALRRRRPVLVLGKASRQERGGDQTNDGGEQQVSFHGRDLSRVRCHGFDDASRAAAARSKISSSCAATLRSLILSLPSEGLTSTTTCRPWAGLPWSLSAAYVDV